MTPAAAKNKMPPVKSVVADARLDTFTEAEATAVLTLINIAIGAIKIKAFEPPFDAAAIGSAVKKLGIAQRMSAKKETLNGENNP